MSRGRSLWGRVKDFWRSVSEGMSLAQLWAQFRRETGASYRVYARDLGDFQAQPGWRGWLRVARAVAWAMFLRLSPPRRIVLLGALVLLAIGLDERHRLYGVLGALTLLALLGLELADRVAMKRDLEIARDIQRWLVPQAPPAVPGVDLAFTTRPANTVAGDYHDAFLAPAPDGAGQRLLLVVADVAGKGLPASLLMATFQASLRTLVQEPVPLHELVVRLNRYCCAHSLEGRRFTTALIAELDPASGRLAYVNAGHNHPALRRADGALEWLDRGGLPLGLREDGAYETGELTLAPEDLLVVYSDGVVEARNGRGEEYGEARFTEWVRATRAGGAAATLGELLASIDAFVGDAGREDDITGLVLRRARG